MCWWLCRRRVDSTRDAKAPLQESRACRRSEGRVESTRDRATRTARVAAVPAAPARAELERTQRLAVGRAQARVCHRVVCEEGAARLVRPSPQAIEPCGWHGVALRRLHEQNHAEDRVLIAIGRRAGADLRRQVVVELPARQALVLAARAAHVRVLAAVGDRPLAHAPPAEEELEREPDHLRPPRVLRRQRGGHDAGEHQAVCLAL
mmetsp:Transcript_27041/g.68819  ORF Transcript_27041/g.68819 Transcript_27041/m.68819 type:complete len:206 (-) Transcript_27041:112-729(-)